MKKIIWMILATLLIAANSVQAALPSNSVWQLNAELTQQDGKVMPLKNLAGKPRLVSMFYSSCSYMCPLIIDTALAVEHHLSKSELDKLGVVFVSIDPKRDSPAALKALMQKRKLDQTRWTFANASEKNVRELAALLSIRYRGLEGGDFNHTSALILIDEQGRIIARTEKMGAQPDAEFLSAAHALLKK